MRNSQWYFQTRWTMNFLAGPIDPCADPGIEQTGGKSVSALSEQLLSRTWSLRSRQLPAAAGCKCAVRSLQAQLLLLQPAPATDSGRQPVQSVPAPVCGSRAGSLRQLLRPTVPGNRAGGGSVTRPPIPSGFPEFFLPMNLSFTKALAARKGPA